jgi:hypothetical protein
MGEVTGRQPKKPAPRPAGWSRGVALSRELVRLGKDIERLQRRGIISGPRMDPLLVRLSEVQREAAALRDKMEGRT